MNQQTISKKASQSVKQTIKKIVKEGSLIYTYHIQQRMKKRGFVSRDIINVLLNGRLKKSKVFDEEYQEWKYTISGRDYDDKRLEIVFSANEIEKEIILITGTRS